MKKVFLITLSVCLIIVSFSIAYFFVIFLPSQQQINTETLKRIEQSAKNTEENSTNIQDPQPTTDTTDIQYQLDSINNSLQEQQEEEDSRNSCEANGGKYMGNGVCCLTNCGNVIGQ